MCGPPDRGHGVVREKKAEPGKFYIVVLCPPTFAKKKGEATDRPHGELVGRDERVRDGVEDEAELLENAERDSDDHFICRELHEFSVIAGKDLYAAALPLDLFNRTGEFDAGSGFSNFLGEEPRKSVVAFADTKEFFAVNLFFGSLLDGE